MVHSLLDTFHVILIMHMIYYYLVTNYDNPSALTESVWYVFSFYRGESVSNDYAGVGVGMCVHGYSSIYRS